MSKLNEFYKQVIVPGLMKEFSYTSIMQVPAIKKITLNMGVGQAVNDKKHINNAVKYLTAIAGQKPVVTNARKAVSGFKIREGWPIGCMVTLRRANMYSFLERLLVIALPRIRDFRGLSPKSFDGRGNYSIGIKENIIFPEVHYDQLNELMGLDITIVTSAKNDQEGFALLKAFQFPFRQA